jgi:hypothetical protein
MTSAAQSESLADPLETVRFWRLNSIAALKMMIWQHESQAQDPDHLSAIKSNKAELAQLQTRENAIKTRHARMYGQKQLTP